LRRCGEVPLWNRGAVMANQFLVEIHDFLSTKLAAIMRQEKEAIAINDHDAQDYCQGQLYELKALRIYLNQNFNLDTHKYY